MESLSISAGDQIVRGFSRKMHRFPSENGQSGDGGSTESERLMESDDDGGSIQVLLPSKDQIDL